MTIEVVFETLKKNSNIDNEFKELIQELIIIFTQFFPNVDLTNLNNRLENLKIIKSNKLVSNDIIDYNSVTNELIFNLEEIMKDYDLRHVLMHGLLRIITAHDNTFGFNQNDRFIALNIGYTEIITNFIIGNNSDLTLFDDEVIATNLIADVIGHDVLFQAYFTNNANLVASSLVDKGVE